MVSSRACEWPDAVSRSSSSYRAVVKEQTVAAGDDPLLHPGRLGLKPVEPGFCHRPAEENGSILWIGTDDASDLARFVEAKIDQQGA